MTRSNSLLPSRSFILYLGSTSIRFRSVLALSTPHLVHLSLLLTLPTRIENVPDATRMELETRMVDDRAATGTVTTVANRATTLVTLSPLPCISQSHLLEKKMLL